MSETAQLESEQEELLSSLVEAHRKVPRDQRHPFQMITSDQSYSAEISHAGLPDRKISAYEGDIRVLLNKRLLTISGELLGVVYNFDIAPEGFTYYRQMKQRNSEPLQRVEMGLRSYLEADNFQRKYSLAYQKWRDAESLLWGSDSTHQFTTIGHLCREATQEFAAALVDQFQPPNIEANKTKTVARIKSVLKLCEGSLGNTEQPFLNALLVYWGTVSDLIQRQEHGGHKEGQPLMWEDGRRVVFQTAVLMLEVDSSLSRKHLTS